MSGPRIIGFLLLATATMPCLALPDFRQSERMHDLVIIPDSQSQTLFYFAPGRVEIARGMDGKPSVHLLSTRYLGTEMFGDAGRTEAVSVLSFDLRRDHPGNETLRVVHERLSADTGSHVELRPLPIQRMPARIVYTPIDQPDAVELPDPALDRQHSRDGVWTERNYSIRLSSADAQAMIDALNRGAALLSLSYGYLAYGIGNQAELNRLSGSPELIEFVQSVLDQDETDPDEQSASTNLVFADTTSLRVDTARWPDLIEQVDINERLPPGFAVLEIRCYDFQNDELNEVFEKRVDIRAHSFAGPPIVESVVFSRFDPGQFVRRVRFPVAVRLDRPFSYRVTTVTRDGRERIDVNWASRESWAALLDVTQFTRQALIGPARARRPDQSLPGTARLESLPVPPFKENSP